MAYHLLSQAISDLLRGWTLSKENLFVREKAASLKQATDDLSLFVRARAANLLTGGGPRVMDDAGQLFARLIADEILAAPLVSPVARRILEVLVTELRETEQALRTATEDTGRVLADRLAQTADEIVRQHLEASVLPSPDLRCPRCSLAWVHTYVGSYSDDADSSYIDFMCLFCGNMESSPSREAEALRSRWRPE